MAVSAANQFEAQLLTAGVSEMAEVIIASDVSKSGQAFITTTLGKLADAMIVSGLRGGAVILLTLPARCDTTALIGNADETTLRVAQHH